MLAVKPRQFGSKLLRITVPPSPLETMLPAIVAAVRAAPGELHDHGSSFPVISIAAMIDELPADPASVKMAYHRGRGIYPDLALWRAGRLREPARPRGGIPSEDNAGNALQWLPLFKGGDQPDNGFFALTPDDEIDLRFFV